MCSSSPAALHSDFAHMNSSQALAFNLFFPFVNADIKRQRILLNALGLLWDSLAETRFEVVLDAQEKTNFDFWLKSPVGEEATVEVKFTEEKFGSAKNNEIYRGRLDRIYRPLLEPLVADSALEVRNFCRDYQLLRNIAFAKPRPPTRIAILLLPAGDTRFVNSTRTWLNARFCDHQHVPLVVREMNLGFIGKTFHSVIIKHTQVLSSNKDRQLFSADLRCNQCLSW